MEFFDPKIDEYVVSRTQPEPELLQKLNRETWAKVLVPRMLAGHYQGRMISMISNMLQPKTVLEIGTYTGYSALCWAEGLQGGGTIHTIDINEELEPMIRQYFTEAGMAETIKLHIGNAVDIIPIINEELDIVYIDADKENYSNYYDLVFDKVKTGGHIIADNVLWSGKVLEEYESLDEETRALADYARKVQEDERVQNIMLPIRDGWMVARKL